MAAEPTAAQKRKLASMGIAMPDGSYYIRDAEDLDNAINAVGRATPNAGETPVERRNAVRRHIIKRAKALNLASRIPDTWNSDGSLKQSAVTTEDFIAHYSKTPVKPGERFFSGEPQGDSPEQQVAHSVTSADELSLEAFERVANGTATTRQKLAVRLSMTPFDNVRHNGSLRNYSEEQARKIRAADDSLNHFGRKGMKWGEHIFGRDRGSSTTPGSSDAARATEYKLRAKEHGTRVLSNDELQHLVTRLNLEQNYSRLTAERSKVEKGHTVVKTILSAGKTGLDIYNTGRQIKKTVDELRKKK
jgi:hypothetical protein